MRAAVRDLTLKALQQRELTLDQIRKGPAQRHRRRDSRRGQARDQGREGAFRYGCRHGRRAAQGGPGEQRRAAQADGRRLRLRRLQPEAGARRAGKARGRIPPEHRAGDRQCRREDQGAVGPGAGEDEAVRHRHGHAGGVNPAGLRKAGTGGDARAARDGLQDGVSAHAELRDPGERDPDRHVRRVWEASRCCQAKGEANDGAQDHKAAKRTAGKPAKRKATTKRAERQPTRKSR